MASSITDYAGTQAEEIETLRAIFDSELVEEKVKIGAWNKRADRCFTIVIRANSESDLRAVISVRVTYPQTYPKTFPLIHLEFVENVRKETMQQLLHYTDNLPDSLLGAPMVFEIVSGLQDILDAALIVDPKTYLNLDEERILRLQADQAKKIEEEEQRKLRLSEGDRGGTDEVKQIATNLLAQRKERNKQRKSQLAQDAAKQSILYQEMPGVVLFERPSRLERRAGISLQVQAVHDKVLYHEGPLGSTFTVQAGNSTDLQSTDRAREPLKAPFLILKEYFIISHPDKVEEDKIVKKLVEELEDDLEVQTWNDRLHPNVVNLANYIIEHTDRSLTTLPPNEVGWKISVLMPFARRGSLLNLLESAGRFSIARIQDFSLQILNGLGHFHKLGFAHADVHLNNILLDQGEASNIVAKLTDAGYVRKMHVFKSIQSAQMSLPELWKSPEGDEEVCKTSNDIWYFGVCLLQMAFGQAVIKEYTSPADLTDKLKLTKPFAALLRKVFHMNPKRRPSAWELLTFEFFRKEDAELVQTPDESHQVLTAHRQRPIERRSPRVSGTLPPFSRYAKDFVEDGRLGRGGFGEVFRARNRIDGQFYAIKKIIAKSKAALDPVLSEANVLSQLNHPNVVRYYSSWIEDEKVLRPENESDSAPGDITLSAGHSDRATFLPPSSRGLDFISHDSLQIVFGSVNGDATSDAVSDDEGDSDLDDAQNDDISSASTSSSTSEADDSGTESRHVENNTTFQPQPVPQVQLSDSSDAFAHSGSINPTATATIVKSEPSSILYIQMEYCKPETLRDVINSGIQHREAEGFRLFRQILQGLSHIHASSIVHRDLKPENIFIDSNSDVRIGDFGLARPGDYQRPSSKGDKSQDQFGSFTTDIGTALYVAPEVQKSGHGKYNEKADMYSLGVILAEMNVSFSTGMERFQVLRSLQETMRETIQELPPELNIPQKKTQAELIHSLTQQEPSLRPSSKELLDSNKIPFLEEDEMFRWARRIATDPGSRFRKAFLRDVFQLHTPAAQSQSTATQEQIMAHRFSSLEDVTAMSKTGIDDPELQALVKQKLTAIYRRHGAIERIDNPAMIPFLGYYAAQDILQFMHESDKVFQLPYDLVLPNALVLAAKKKVSAHRTFVFGNVFRQNASTICETNFDIVTIDPTNLASYDAEALKVLDEILDTFPNLRSGQLCYHISHSSILDAVLAFSGIEEGKWPLVKETMSKLNTGEWTWTKIRHELRTPPINASSVALDSLERFDFRDTLVKAVTRLRGILPNHFDLDSAFKHLQEVAERLSRLGVLRPFYLSPLSSYNEKFYRGNFFFQCVYDHQKKAVFAAGGRYDKLIEEHRLIGTQGHEIHTVGFQLSYSSLTAALGIFLKKQARSKSSKKLYYMERNTWNLCRFDVLIDSFDESFFPTTGLDILKSLWEVDISAQFASDSLSSRSEYLKNDETKENYGWMVLIKSEEVVKVREFPRKDEVEVRVSELAMYLLNEIREREREEGRLSLGSKPPASLYRHISIPEVRPQDPDSTSRDVDVRLLISNSKHKKVNRKTVVEDAQSRAQEWRNQASEYKIFAIETSSNIFTAIEKKTQIQDPDSWRKTIQELHIGDRAYVGDVHKALEEYKKDGNAAVYLYNFRTKQIFLYPLSKG